MSHEIEARCVLLVIISMQKPAYAVDRDPRLDMAVIAQKANRLIVASEGGEDITPLSVKEVKRIMRDVFGLKRGAIKTTRELCEQLGVTGVDIDWAAEILKKEARHDEAN